jgi:broad-specificity NMP kinase
MKTIIIYGAPAVGKYTVAKELSKLTGFALLHNHLLNDLVTTACDFGSYRFGELVHSYRLDIMNEAVKAKRSGLIMTWVYSKTYNDYLKKVVKQAKKYNGKIIFIHLVCKEDELTRRLKNPSRKMFNKITSIKTLKKVMKKFDVISDIPYKPNYVIDNTKLSPTKTAKIIKKIVD